METSSTPKSSPGGAQSLKVVVATTVALSFISYWRGAAIVLSDLASSMFYAGGIAEHAIGKSAAWYVLGVMIFSFAVRSVYMESCGMFVRGGVYVVVRDSMGPFMARLSVSALVFDYVLTGPISSVSAGQYLGRLLNEFAELAHQPYRIDPNHFAAFFAVLVTGYFWRSNVKGIHESSGKALRIMQITANIVCTYAVFSTGVITVFAGYIIPEKLRGEYVENLLGGLAMNLAGPYLLRLLFHVFVVLVGIMILSGAVSTAIIGANGI